MPRFSLQSRSFALLRTIFLIFSFFLKENNNYILAIIRDGEIQKPGLAIPVQKRQYNGPDPTKEFQDEDIVAAISPNGKRIAYLTTVNPNAINEPLYHLYVSNIDGSDKVLLTNPEWKAIHGAFDKYIHWDANSKNIIYVDTKSDVAIDIHDVYSINIDTKEKTKVMSTEFMLDKSTGDWSQLGNISIIPIGYIK